MNLPNRQFAHLHVICLPERLGHKQVAQIWGELKPMLRQARRDVLLDMAQISRLDWNGVTLLMDVYAEMRRLGGRLALLGVQPMVLAFLDLTQINQLMPVFADEQAALLGFREGV